MVICSNLSAILERGEAIGVHLGREHGPRPRGLLSRGRRHEGQRNQQKEQTERCPSGQVHGDFLLIRPLTAGSDFLKADPPRNALIPPGPGIMGAGIPRSKPETSYPGNGAVITDGSSPSFCFISTESIHQLNPAWRATVATEAYQRWRSSNQLWLESQIAVIAKVTSRVVLAMRAGTVFPIA